MKRMILSSFLMILVMTVLLGLVYPLVMTGISLVLFPKQAGGSIIYKEGKPAGSTLIGQSFSQERYLHGRPSAAGEKGYDGLASGGSNLGPTSRKLLTAAGKCRDDIKKENLLSAEIRIPSDLVLASGSGLDPHISPPAAIIQADRIARARGIAVDEVRKVIAARTEKPFLGFIGEPRVNVLMVNMDLDSSNQGSRQ
jgi:potassium-transporting ATPase KdpC subunit